MYPSKRQQRRSEYLIRNRERIDRLLEKYKTSEEIQKQIDGLEKKSEEGQLTARDITELEALHSQYRLLREFERSGGKNLEEDNSTDNTSHEEKPRDDGIKVLSLKEKSVFWDAELNPLGKQPIDEVKLNQRFRGEYHVPFASNIGESELEKISYPSKEKPRFYLSMTIRPCTAMFR